MLRKPQPSIGQKSTLNSVSGSLGKCLALSRWAVRSVNFLNFWVHWKQPWFFFTWIFSIFLSFAIEKMNSSELWLCLKWIQHGTMFVPKQKLHFGQNTANSFSLDEVVREQRDLMPITLWFSWYGQSDSDDFTTKYSLADRCIFSVKCLSIPSREPSVAWQLSHMNTMELVLDGSFLANTSLGQNRNSSTADTLHLKLVLFLLAWNIFSKTVLLPFFAFP